MNDENKQLWTKVLGEIQLEISEGSFIGLFKNTALLSIEDDIATIAAPNAIHINMIQKKYERLIKQSLDKHTKKNITIIFIPKIIQTKPLETQEKTGPLFVQTPPLPQKPIGHLPRVRSDYTFATLAVSDSNRLAFVSAQNVATHLGKSYNPLFIYGPVGVGKTHLMQAIANEVYQKNPDLKIIYITSEEFTNEVVEAIRSNDTAKMKRKFRSANLLIIDDIQFIAGKDKVQEELFHTFNILIDNSAQIVLSSDKPPSEIQKLEKRLSSRFAGGLTVDVEAPDFEMRTAILLKKAEKFGYDLPIDVAKMLAERDQDARSLEGELTKLISTATQQGGMLTESLAKQIVDTRSTTGVKSRWHADEVIKLVCERYGIKATQLKGPKRDAYLVKARQITMYILKYELRISLEEIGNLLGGRDHTTIMHGVDKMGKILTENIPPAEDILWITKQIRG